MFEITVTIIGTRRTRTEIYTYDDYSKAREMAETFLGFDDTYSVQLIDTRTGEIAYYEAKINQ